MEQSNSNQAQPVNIHGIFSLGSNQILNWYYNDNLIENSGLMLDHATDGLHTMLTISSQVQSAYGRYSLKIEGTNISDYTTITSGR